MNLKNEMFYPSKNVKVFGHEKAWIRALFETLFWFRIRNYLYWSVSGCRSGSFHQQAKIKIDHDYFCWHLKSYFLKEKDPDPDFGPDPEL
jgi:hypothetical protein